MAAVLCGGYRLLRIRRSAAAITRFARGGGQGIDQEHAKPLNEKSFTDDPLFPHRQRGGGRNVSVERLFDITHHYGVRPASLLERVT